MLQAPLGHMTRVQTGTLWGVEQGGGCPSSLDTHRGCPGRSGRGATLPVHAHTSGCKQRGRVPAGTALAGWGLRWVCGSLGCPAACGISLDQGLNLCSLHLDGPPHVKGQLPVLV